MNEVSWARDYMARTYGGRSVTLTYSQPPVIGYTVTTTTPAVACPDLLRYEQIGEADGLRGRVVRAFFWLLRAWPP